MLSIHHMHNVNKGANHLYRIVTRDSYHLILNMQSCGSLASQYTTIIGAFNTARVFKRSQFSTEQPHKPLQRSQNTFANALAFLQPHSANMGESNSVEVWKWGSHQIPWSNKSLFIWQTQHLNLSRDYHICGKRHPQWQVQY